MLMNHLGSGLQITFLGFGLVQRKYPSTTLSNGRGSQGLGQFYVQVQSSQGKQ